MTSPLPSRASLPEWHALSGHAANLRAALLRDLFAADAGRAERLSLDACGLHVDYAKQRVTDQTLTLLVRLAEAMRAQAHTRDA